MRIDAKGIHYKELNEQIRRAIKRGEKEFVLDNVNGQRYIGDGLTGKDVRITINGVPGNDLAAFMDGPEIVVNSNCQDAIANTMNDGLIVVHGNTGDTAGHSMRGGKVFVEGNVGYRVGIHMKAYESNFPALIIGGTAGDFFGEYMAGGLIILLGLDKPAGESIAGKFIGTGMHGGAIFIRGEVEEWQLGREVKIFEPDKDDLAVIKKYTEEFAKHFKLDPKVILKEKFIKLIPYTHRPYGKLYAY